MSVWQFRARLGSRGLVLLGLFGIVLVAVVGGAWWHFWPEHLLDRAHQGESRENWRSVAGFLERYVFWRPHDSEARLLLAKAYLGIGKHRSADVLRQLEQISDSDPHGVEARVHSGEVLKLGLHRGADAERMYRRALQLDPKCIAARQGLFTLYWWQQRRTPQVGKWLDEMYELGTPRQRLKALVQRFWFYYAEFPPDAQFPLMQQYLRADPTDFGARVGLARCLLRVKQYAGGIALLHECLKEQPDDVTARTLLADHYLERGEWPKAQQVIDEWPAETREWNYWELRGRYLEMAESNFAEAVGCFEEVLKTRPDRWAARHRLGRCLEAVGQWERAEAERQRTEKTSQALLATRVEYLLDEVLQRLDTQPQYCRQLGEFYDELSMPQEAKRWFMMESELKELAAEEQPIGQTTTPNAEGAAQRLAARAEAP